MSTPLESSRMRSRPLSWIAAVVRPSLIGLVAVSLVAAIGGGLLRAGVARQLLQVGDVASQALVAHAELMLSAFLGTAISIERAVALKARWSYLVPIGSGISGLLILNGAPQAGGWLAAAAAFVFVAVNAALAVRQWASHSSLLLLGAMAWLVGNLLAAIGRTDVSPVTWWFAFVVLTIAAERLEMTRLMRLQPAAEPLLRIVIVALLLGAVLSAATPQAGGVLFGTALLALSVWLARFDVARRTIHAHGLSRYMAVCLLTGYVWLGSAGIAWVGMSLAYPGRDLALHGLGLGFIVSMMMGHAPVILPAVARIKLRFGAWFYVPVMLLHGSLLLRLAGGVIAPEMRVVGAAANAVAIGAFALTIFASALIRPDSRRRPRKLIETH
jgi:hypothetical protein